MLNTRRFIPSAVAGFLAIEGIDVPIRVAEEVGSLNARQRIAKAIASAQKRASQQKRRYATLDDAAKRMQEANTFLSAAQAHHLTLHGVDRNEDGTFSWKFDDYGRWPKFFNTPAEEMDELVSQIKCPVLLVLGTASDVPDPKESGLLERIPNARAVTVEGAGHWVHHDRLDETLRLIRSFLEERAPLRADAKS